MSAHVLLNLLNELEKLIKCKDFINFCYEFDKFKNTEAGMLDFIYHMTLNFFLQSRFWCAKRLLP